MRSGHTFHHDPVSVVQVLVLVLVLVTVLVTLLKIVIVRWLWMDRGGMAHGAWCMRRGA